MKPFFILISLLAYTYAAALECTEESFAKGENEIRKIHFLYETTTPGVEKQTSVKDFKTSGDTDEKQLKELEDQLFFLTKNSSDLFKARLINEENIRRWKSLEKTCNDDLRSKAEQAYADAKERKFLIQTRLSSIQERIDATKAMISSGK